MRGTWLALAALALATGCGEASPPRTATDAAAPVASPTAVPAATGQVATTERVLVVDDGSGPRMCVNGIESVSPPKCDAFPLAGWNWEDAGAFEVDGGVRWGSYALTGTFDGSTFTVDEATQPDPAPYDFDFEIPCPEPAGGWQVVDDSLTSRDALLDVSTLEQEVPGFAMVAVSTATGEPGPQDPFDTVVTLYVAGDAAAAESVVRTSWGGMLCVSEVEYSHAELAKVQQALLRVPGLSEVGSGNPDNQVELTVFNDDGSIQRWADQEFGAGVVAVESLLQPVG